MKKRASRRRRSSGGNPPEEPPRRWSWRKRLGAVVLSVVVLFGLLWTTGILAAGAFLCADNQLALRNDLDALRWSEWAGRLNGDPARVAFLKARVQRRLNDLDAMERHLLTAEAAGLAYEKVEKERAFALAQSGRIDQVVEKFSLWMREPGGDVADIADAYAVGLQSKGRPYETKVALTVWSAECPRDPKPHVQLGRLAEMEQRDEDAEAHYRFALKKNPDYPMALYALSRLLLKRKRPEEGLPLLKKCTRTDPQTKPAVDTIAAGCLRLLGEREAARKLLQQVFDLPQTEVDRAYLRLAMPPKPEAAAFERGKLEFDARRFEVAAKYFRLAADRAPDHFDAEYQLGVVLKQLGRIEEAEEVIGRVAEKRELLAKIHPFISRLESKPNDFEARYQIGNILLENGQFDRGLFYLKDALVDAPEHLPTHRRLVEFYKENHHTQPRYAELAERHEQILDRIERKAQ